MDRDEPPRGVTGDRGGVAGMARRAFAEGIAGRFQTFDRALETLSNGTTPEAAAWALALEALRFHAEPNVGRLPDARELADVAVESRAPVSLACALAARGAMLAFDWPQHARLVALHRQLADPSDPWVTLGAGWADVVAGSSNVSVDALDSKGESSDDAVIVLERATLRAALALSRDDLTDATALARRASRMARTEAFPQQEYLANLVLARVRRLSDKPYLAARILSALLDVAPVTFHPWLTWELLLAQGASAVAPLDEADTRPAAEAARALAELLTAVAEDGEVARFDAALARVVHLVGAHAQLADDVRCLEALLDPRVAPPDDTDLARWCIGLDDRVPRGLGGVAAPQSYDDPDRLEVAYVVAGWAHAPRRVLSTSLAFVSKVTGAQRLPSAPGRQARTESTLAALALAGPRGLPENELFRSVYGFEYEPAVHQSVRNMLYHRIRGRLGDLGVLERSDDDVRVLLLAPVLLPDPRCSPAPEVDVLRVLARWGHASAKEAADKLGIPLRTAQKALRRLADDGACRREGQGRKMVYHLEDTTFAEPTSY